MKIACALFFLLLLIASSNATSGQSYLCQPKKVYSVDGSGDLITSILEEGLKLGQYVFDTNTAQMSFRRDGEILKEYDYEIVQPAGTHVALVAVHHLQKLNRRGIEMLTIYVGKKGMPFRLVFADNLVLGNCRIGSDTDTD